MEQTIDIQELVQDQHNFNKGTAQGEKLMQKSLTELGAGRSILIDKDGNIRRGDSYYGTFFKTDKPRPEPIDPSTLKTPEGSINADIYDEEEEEFEEIQEDLESTEDAAEDAGIEGENDVQT